MMVLGGILFSAPGCGDNLAGPPGSVSAPRNLKALSVNESTVFLQWNAPSNVDSAFGGYRLEYGSVGIDLSRNQISYMVSSLQPGEQVFTVFSLRSNGTKADGSSIRWAPATRFDSVYSLLEYTQLQPGRGSGINVGSRTTSPFTLEVNGSAGNVLDFYLFGGDGFSQQPLALYAGDQFAGSFRPTRFSTVTHSSSSLDLPLTTFPADTTFIRQSIPVTDNTIYYARVVINNVEVHFVRIHVRQRAGATYPERVIELRLSLQRVAGLLFANKENESSYASPYTAPTWNVQPHHS
jgi:hypothetical protein